MRESPFFDFSWFLNKEFTFIVLRAYALWYYTVCRNSIVEPESHLMRPYTPPAVVPADSILSAILCSQPLTKLSGPLQPQTSDVPTTYRVGLR
jgi:hypothetical protein